ncbi:DUF459 domain-containing protein [Devosia sp.]|uniref:SGNH/GDSL hydrolase family protein n=1 Tax=Devosia sp. TaxID=1871048 RepID=UPI003BACDC68
MRKKSNRPVLFVVGLIVAALVLGDLLPIFAEAREMTTASPVVVAAADGRVLVAQATDAQAPAQKPKKRKTLLEFLFGDKPDEQQDEPPVVEKKVVRQPKAALPEVVKPTIPKADGATRLVVFGDSMAVDVGKALERYYAEDPNIVVLTQGVGSSGIVRTDFFDWPKTITDEIGKNSFDIAVMVIGVNDRQKMSINGQSYPSLSPEWLAEYSARVSGIVRQLRDAKKPTIWVGLPPMEAPKFGQTMIQVNEVDRLAAFGGGAEFLDIYEKFANEDGKYTARGPDLSGTQVRMRKDDGIHFSTAGADKLAFYLSQSLKNYYRGGGRVGIEVADALAGTDAQMMLRPPYQGLGQMKLLELAGAVMPLSNVTRRAAELVTADTADEDAVGFNMSELVDAPVGRVDAFWVGKAPVAEKPAVP